MKTQSTIWLIMAAACVVLQAVLNEPMISTYIMGCVLASVVYDVGHKLQEREK